MSRVWLDCCYLLAGTSKMALSNQNSMALIFTIIFTSKPFFLHNIMSTTGVWGVQATMLSLTSPQKNVFKRPEQNVRIFFLPIFIACLEQHIYYVLRKSEIAQFEWAYKAGWFHHFFSRFTTFFLKCFWIWEYFFWSTCTQLFNFWKN